MVPEGDPLVNDAEAALRLKALVCDAHREACYNNNNLSSDIIKRIALTKVPFQQALIGAIASGGERHGPTRQCRLLIYGGGPEAALELLERGEKVPGFGNSFFREDIDAAWFKVRDFVKAEMPEDWERLDRIHQAVLTVKPIHPNAASFTAICAHKLGLPVGAELALAIEARVMVLAIQWAEVYHNA